VGDLELVEHMKREGFLFEAGGLLSMGQASERAFGKKNFLELYAVFSSPVLYRVMTDAKREIGSLEQAFVDRLVEEMSAFLLGGVSVDHKERVVRVKPAPRGKKPTWGGFLPQFLGREVCEEMRAILASDDDDAFLDERAKAALAVWREELGPLLRRRGDAMQVDDSTLVWWTFAGGRINQTLKYALEWQGRWKVVPDNFALRIEGDGVGFGEVERVAGVLRAPGFWEATETKRRMLAAVPEYRLSKFQRVLPPAWQVEVVGSYLLDFEGAKRWLGSESADDSVGSTAVERAPTLTVK
jgi:ATP-dependent Lhr-like helicase